MEENQNNDINNDQGSGVFYDGVGENLDLGEEHDLEDISKDDVLGLVPGLGVRNIVVQDSVTQQETAPVESVVETSTEVMDSIEEETESYMDDDAV